MAIKRKNPAWYYYALAFQTIFILIALGMLKDLFWIL